MDLESTLKGEKSLCLGVRILEHTSLLNLADEKINRSGIIPYCFVRDSYGNDKLLLAFGLTSYSKSLNVIGGGFDESKGDYNIVDTAIREFEEETGNYFKKINRNEILDSYVVKTSNSYSFLWKTEYKVGKLKGDGELSLIVWITPKQLEILHKIQSGILYKNKKIKFGYELHKIIGKLTHKHMYMSEYSKDVRDEKKVISLIESTSIFDFSEKMRVLTDDIFISCNSEYICLGISNYRFYFNMSSVKNIEKILKFNCKNVYYVNNNPSKYFNLIHKRFIPKNPEIYNEYISKYNLEIEEQNRFIYEVNLALEYDDKDKHFCTLLEKKSKKLIMRYNFFENLSHVNDKIINGYEIDEPDCLISLKLIMKMSQFKYILP